METIQSLMEKRRAARAQVDHYLQECDGHPSILNPLSRGAYLFAVREEERLIDLLIQIGCGEGGELILYLVFQSEPPDLDWKAKIGEELGEVSLVQKHTKCRRCNTFDGCDPEKLKSDSEGELEEHMNDGFRMASDYYEDIHGPDGLNTIETFWLVRLTLKWKEFQDHGDPTFWDWKQILGISVECHVHEASPLPE